MRARPLSFVALALVAVALLAGASDVAAQARENGDVNGDGTIDIADAIYLVTYQFSGGPPPVGIPYPPPPVLDDDNLLIGKASAKLSQQPGRAIVSARGNHFVVDSVPPYNGPNEEVNPFDIFLGALSTCGTFLAEQVAREEGIELSRASARAEADFAAPGLLDPEINPRVQVFRVHLDLPGVDDAGVEAIKREWSRRCPIYTTFVRSAPIEVTTGGEIPPPPIEGLATAAPVTADLSNQPGRAIVSARGNHFVIDSVPPLMGPNEERNPLDLLLGALATCGAFGFEKVALDQGLTLTDVEVQVDGRLDPRGFQRDSEVSPHLQKLSVHVTFGGIDDAQAEVLSEIYKKNCPAFTTLNRAVPIDLTVSTTN